VMPRGFAFFSRVFDFFILHSWDPKSSLGTRGTPGTPGTQIIIHSSER